MRFVSSLRFRLLAFALVVALPMFLFVLTSYAELRSTEAADTKARALATARELATRQRSLIDQTRVLLATLAQLPQVRPRAGAECDALLAKLLGASAGYAFMGTATVEGALVCSVPAAEGPVSVADRPYFRRTLESGGTAFGEFQIGRVSGKAVLAAGTPLLDDEGTIEGVVIVSMDLVWLAQEAAVTTLPPGTAVTVFDRAGRVLLRYPDPAHWVGMDVADTPIVETILAAAGEGTTEAVGLDGVRRLYAFSPLYVETGLIGAYVSVGIPTTMAYAKLDAIRDRTLIWLSVMAAALMVLAWVGGDVLVLLRVKKLLLTTRRLAAGELGVRTGMAGATDELGELGQAFDEMADSLERRSERLQALNATDKAIMTGQDLPQKLEVIAQQVAVQLAVDAVDVLLYDRSSAELVFAASTGFREEDIRRSRLQVGEGHAGRAAAEQRIIFVPDLAASADAARRDLIMGEGFVSHVCVPLVVNGQLQGILDLFQRDRLAPDSEWFAFLDVLALQTAIALDHARLFSETQEQARQLDLLLKTVPQGVALLDRDLSLVMANPLGQTYLERLCAGPLGDKPLTRLGSRSMSEIIAPRELDPMKVAWQEVTMEGPTQIFEVASSPFRDKGHTTGWVLVLDDVTEERRRQVEMRSQERLATVGQMAAGIAHDFNNILTPILIYSELAALALPKSDRNYHNLQHVLTAVGRAKELINQILLFARQSPQREHKPILLQPLVKEALRLVRAALPTTIRIDEEIHARSPGNHATVVADPTQIHQILINLCTNAQHAMHAHGGVLTVSLDEVDVDLDLAAVYPNLHVGSYVRLSVGDTGHGMTPEVQSRIFEPFFTTKRVGEGTGMGLAVVHGIVMDHGGEILVESWPGEGTVFRIYLPQTDGEASDEETREATLVRGTGKILVVDDEETLALAAQQILESLGYAVTCTSRSPEALELFRSQPDRFDLVITDLTMPDMTGIELAQEVLQIRSDMPIVLITGFSAASTAAQVQMLGIRATLLKPFSAGDLSRTVHQILEQQT